jgi:hypothetical protein
LIQINAATDDMRHGSVISSGISSADSDNPGCRHPEKLSELMPTGADLIPVRRKQNRQFSIAAHP